MIRHKKRGENAGGFSPTVTFLPGRSIYLAHYLPPYRPTTVSAWLANTFPHSELRTPTPILDPFGSSPYLCYEIASMGYPLIVCSNNPINKILIEFLASPPTHEEISSLIAEISATRKMDQRLETFIRSLYLSHCNKCKSTIEVENYLWEKTSQNDEPTLISKKYTCPSCGISGEFPILPDDLESLRTIPPPNILYSQAMSRVVDPDDDDKDAVSEALNTYRPRTLYALFNLINKLESLSLTHRKKILLHTLLISLFDISTLSQKNSPKTIGDSLTIY